MPRPFVVLPPPSAPTPDLHDLAVGIVGHWGAALYAHGLDAFVVDAPAGDPRVTLVGSEGMLMCHGAVRPVADLFVDLALMPDRGHARVLDAHTLHVVRKCSYRGSADALLRFTDRVLAAVLQAIGRAPPSRDQWRALLRVGSADAAARMLRQCGEDRRRHTASLLDLDLERPRRPSLLN